MRAHRLECCERHRVVVLVHELEDGVPEPFRWLEFEQVETRLIDPGDRPVRLEDHQRVG